MILRDIAHAWRSLRRAPGVVVTALLTLALGIGANATMFALVDRLLLQPPAGIAEPSRISVLSVNGVTSAGKEFKQRTMSYAAFTAVEAAGRGDAEIAATSWEPSEQSLGSGRDARSMKVLLVTGRFLALLGAQPQLGRLTDAADDDDAAARAAVVLSDDGWRRLFARSPDIIGRPLEIAGHRYTVIGVGPRGFTGADLRPVDAWIPIAGAGDLRFGGADWRTARNTTWLTVYARSKPGISASTLSTHAAAGYRLAGEPRFEKINWHLQATPLNSWVHEARKDSRKIAWLLTAMSALVLVIACINVANLLLARGLDRRHEISVRLALGASRTQLASSVFFEALIVAAAGGVCAYMATTWTSAVVAHRFFPDLVWSDAGGYRLGAYVMVVSVIAAVAASILPSVQLSRPDLTGGLTLTARRGGDRSRSRAALLVAQAALSVMLLIGTGLFARSLVSLSHIDVGFDLDRTILATMSVKRPQPEALRLYEAMAERVRALPSIERVSTALTAPTWASFATGISIPGRDSVRSPETGTWINGVDDQYFPTLGIRILRGRGIAPTDLAGTARVAVINESMAQQLWAGEDAIGKCFRLAGEDTLPCRTVVGVAANTHRQNLIEDNIYFVHLPLEQMPSWASVRRVLLVRPRPGSLTTASRDIRDAMQGAAAGLPYAEVRTLSSRFDQERRPWQLGATMFGACGLLALLLGAVGLYGVMSFNVSRRTHELGVRMALGAQISDVLRMVLRQSITTAGVGCALGVTAALAAAPYLAPLLYNTPARDPVVIGVVLVIMMSTALVASAIPARRAVRIDPATALREE